MKEFNELNKFKNLKFKSVTTQDILQAVGLLDKLGYEVVRNDFSVYDAASHNGVCAWDDGEITEGWLDDDNFEQVTLEDLKEMVGGDKDNTFTLERLLGCKVEFSDPFGITVNGYISKVRNSGLVHVTCDLIKGVVGVKNLTFFTEDGDELTFDEYVNLYYGG